MEVRGAWDLFIQTGRVEAYLYLKQMERGGKSPDGRSCPDRHGALGNACR